MSDLVVVDTADAIYVLTWFRSGGILKEDYPGEKDHGVSLTSPDWIRMRIREVGGLREAFFKERGWDNHQDVFGFVAE